jgi:hypothetical protein
VPDVKPGTLPPCPTLCDADCEAECHEVHVPDHGNKRGHQPHGCQDIREAIAAAIADSTYDPDIVVAAPPEQEIRVVPEATVAAAVTAERERIIALATECGTAYTVVTSGRDPIRERRPFARHPGLTGDTS